MPALGTTAIWTVTNARQPATVRVCVVVYTQQHSECKRYALPGVWRNNHHQHNQQECTLALHPCLPTNRSAPVHRVVVAVCQHILGCHIAGCAAEGVGAPCAAVQHLWEGAVRGERMDGGEATAREWQCWVLPNFIAASQHYGAASRPYSAKAPLLPTSEISNPKPAAHPLTPAAPNQQPPSDTSSPKSAGRPLKPAAQKLLRPATSPPWQTQSLPKPAAHLGKPKVSQLDVARGVDEHILRLQVAVHCAGGWGAKQAGCGPQGRPGRGQQRPLCPQGQLAGSRKAGLHSSTMSAGQHPPMGMQSLHGHRDGACPTLLLHTTAQHPPLPTYRCCAHAGTPGPARWSPRRSVPATRPAP